MFSFVFRGDIHPIGTMDRTVKEHPTTWSCWELPAVSTRTTEPNPLGARAGLPEVSVTSSREIRCIACSGSNFGSSVMDPSEMRNILAWSQHGAWNDGAWTRYRSSGFNRYPSAETKPS
jgi:hypothetical protein